MNTVIKADKLCYRVGDHYILNNVTWKVQAGERWVVFGLNGSGKTTLLSILAGYNAFTSGSVEVFGEEYTNDNIYKNRCRIGWVSSSFFDKYLSWESVKDVVLSGATGTLSRGKQLCDEDTKKAFMLLKKLGIREKAEQPYIWLSKGERQNVIIARALMCSPEIIILDEPVNGFDVYARERMFRTIEDLAKNEKMTIIYVTHYVEEILPVFEKAILLKAGQIRYNGKLSELFTSEQMSELLQQNASVEIINGKYVLKVAAESIFGK